MLKLVINGCNGKMGHVLVETAEKDPGVIVVAGVDKNIENYKNKFPVYSSISEFEGSADVLLDFSRPEAIQPLLEYAVNTKTPLIVATTGIEGEDLQHIRKAAEHIPVFVSANMSLGVLVMVEISKLAASILGENFDIEIVDFHHNEKVDAPSGTALMLADAINTQLDEDKHYVYGRNAEHGRRKPDEIGIHALRGGTYPGEHRVIFAGLDEVVEIRHLALSRKIFALGAIKAAKFIASQKEGLYNMEHLIKQ